MTAGAAFSVLKPFSRAWWCEWHRRVEAGEPVMLMGELARRGRPFQVDAASAPTEAAKTALVAVHVVSDDAFREWVEHFRCRGIRLPQPHSVPVAFMPSERPPWTKPPIMMMAFSGAERSRRRRRALRIEQAIIGPLTWTNRLPEDALDEADKIIDRAQFKRTTEELLLDWAADIKNRQARDTSVDLDPIPRRRQGEE